MWQKIKDAIFGKVIIQKVVAKFVKHGITALVGLVAAHPVLNDAGISIDYSKLETWSVIALTGLAGSAWNFIEHRVKK